MHIDYPANVSGLISIDLKDKFEFLSPENDQYKIEIEEQFEHQNSEFKFLKGTDFFYQTKSFLQSFSVKENFLNSSLKNLENLISNDIIEKINIKENSIIFPTIFLKNENIKIEIIQKKLA